jgi:hypothetical protein
LTSSPLLNTTKNSLESFKAFFDTFANPGASTADKQAAMFAFGSALVAAGNVVFKSPIIGKIGGAFAGAGFANSFLQLKIAAETLDKNSTTSDEVWHRFGASKRP